ncbi:MAG: hypothetical protein CMO01_00240 [Thalassobius sp.]|nr:hypothetical protein [Thalassovita sp.]
MIKQTSIFLLIVLLSACNPMLKPSTNVNIRKYPDSKAELLGTAEEGKKYSLLAKTSFADTLNFKDGEKPSAPWYLIETKDGTDGWVFGHFADKIRKPEEVKTVQKSLFLNDWVKLSPLPLKDTVRREHVKNLRKETLQLSFSTAPSFPYPQAIIPGKQNKLGVVGADYDRNVGKVLYALRFLPITTAVEERYFLPSGLLLCMIIQESSGLPFLPNSIDDGGIGLCHMQPSIANEFGLTCYEKATMHRDEEFGRKLRDLVEKNREYPFSLFQADERFNPLLNLDAAGRMMATYMAAGANPAYGGPLRSAVARYSGKYNFKHYWESLIIYMSLLHDTSFLNKAEAMFNFENSITLREYMLAWQEYHEDYLQLEEYKKQKQFLPENAPIVMETYYRHMVK